MIERIKEMHQKFGISEVPFSGGERLFRIACMQEELDEFNIAENRPAEELDALVDLLVFTLGTVDRMGWSDVLDEAFNRVMDANMAKQLGPNNKRGGFMIDLQKPEGWTPPNLEDLV